MFTFFLFFKSRHRFFPPVRRLLTEEEYIKEGHDFTIQSLRELSQYCHSPECDSWKIISRLKNPDRFVFYLSYFKIFVLNSNFNKKDLQNL